MTNSEERGGAARRTWIITTLAEYQSRFWVDVCIRLRALGQPTFVFSYDDRSVAMFAAAGIDCANIYALGQRLAAGRDIGETFRQQCAELGIGNPNLMLSHERTAFRIGATEKLEKKFVIYALGAQDVIDTLLKREKKPLFIQELGGFLSVLSAFYVATRAGLQTIFIEPSFFRGRMFLTEGSLKAPIIRHEAGREVSNAVLDYLEETLKSRQIVIPRKDRAHYNPVHRKIGNVKNIRRLFEKLRDKYIFGMHQDFGYIGAHVGAHLHMYRNGRKLKSSYTSLPEAGRFIYYPLHVPADVALTFRSPEYLDQLSLIDYLLRNLPYGYRLAIKEHPAQIGAIDARRVRTLARHHDNLCVLPPSLNNYAVIERAALIVSVNSKSGAEAMLMGKPVVVLGDAFYAQAPLVKKVETLKELPDAMTDALAAPRHAFSKVAAYFQCVFDHTYPGELYVDDTGNIAAFADSLLQACVASSARDRGPFIFRNRELT